MIYCRNCLFVRSDWIPDCCPLCGDTDIRRPVVLSQRGDGDIERQKISRISFDEENMYIHCEREKQ